VSRYGGHTQGGCLALPRNGLTEGQLRYENLRYHFNEFFKPVYKLRKSLLNNHFAITRYMVLLWGFWRLAVRVLNGLKNVVGVAKWVLVIALAHVFRTINRLDRPPMDDPRYFVSSAFAVLITSRAMVDKFFIPI